MAAFDILSFENMLLLKHYLTNHHQICWKCYHSNLEHIYEVVKNAVTKILHGNQIRLHHL